MGNGHIYIYIYVLMFLCTYVYGDENKDID